MSIKIVEVELGTKTQNSAAVEKKRKSTENLANSKEFQLQHVGDAGDMFSYAGELYMQAGN